MTLEEVLRQVTVDVPTAGRVFYGLSRNGSFAAAWRGEIPTVLIGRRRRVPVAQIAAQLGLRPNHGAPTS